MPHHRDRCEKRHVYKRSAYRANGPVFIPAWGNAPCHRRQVFQRQRRDSSPQPDEFPLANGWPRPNWNRLNIVVPSRNEQTLPCQNRRILSSTDRSYLKTQTSIHLHGSGRNSPDKTWQSILVPVPKPSRKRAEFRQPAPSIPRTNTRSRAGKKRERGMVLPKPRSWRIFYR